MRTRYIYIVWVDIKPLPYIHSIWTSYKDARRVLLDTELLVGHIVKYNTNTTIDVSLGRVM